MKPSDGCAFIAYDLKDADEAEKLAEALEARGVQVWLGWRDKAAVRDASGYAEQLREAAANSSALLLLVTGRKVDLEELGDLTQRAYAADKPIYAVRTSETATVPDFPALLSAQGVADAYGSERDAVLGRLADALGGSSDASGSEPATEEETPSASASEPEAPAVPSWPTPATPAAPSWPSPPSPPAPAASGWPEQPATPAASGWPQSPAAPAASGWPQTPAPAAAPVAPAWPQAPAAPQAAAWQAPQAAAPAAAWQPGGAAPLADEQRLREYVGPNADYYLRKWGDMDRSRSSTSWNFAAFFLSGFWLAYRKMVVPALIVVLGFYAAFVLGLLQPGLGALFNLLLLGLAVFLGLMGNRLYRTQAERAVADPTAAHPGALQGRGGTSVGLALGLLAAYVVLASVTVYLFMDQRMGVFYQPSYSPGYYSSSGGTSGGSMDTSMGNTAMPTTTTTTGTTVYSTWLSGKWGMMGSNCLSWVHFYSDGSLLDNSGTTGSWTLNNYTSTLNLTTPAGARTGTVSRQGEMLIINSTNGRQEWQRCI